MHISRYVVDDEASEKEFPQGVRDKGRAGRRLDDFERDPQAVIAGLKKPELAALRGELGAKERELEALREAVPVADSDTLELQKVSSVLLTLRLDKAFVRSSRPAILFSNVFFSSVYAIRESCGCSIEPPPPEPHLPLLHVLLPLPHLTGELLLELQTRQPGILE